MVLAFALVTFSNLIPGTKSVDWETKLQQFSNLFQRPQFPPFLMLLDPFCPHLCSLILKIYFGIVRRLVSSDDIFYQITKVLEFIAKKEGLQLPSGFATRIAEKSNRSLRRAILSFETCRVQQLSSLTPFINQWQFHLCFLWYLYGYRYPFTNNQAMPPMDWEEYVSEIASDIMKEQSPKRLGTICILLHINTIMFSDI
ncbi:Replication factor C subunit 3 [Vitis vinifera]|uniref:Replication factor C subunit 3 n=1 Tax=Vitis vinifera TaxID=29760 RepID=A0A438I0T6_VITVI|nr:Replication factor C subunit 3 [Vitis vinifera]